MSLNNRSGVPAITRDINYGKNQILDANNNVIGETGNSSDAKLLTKVGGLAYFSANDGTDTALWKTDGTLKGTQKLKSFSSSLSNFTEAGGFLYFVGNESATGTELWRSDGTASGTLLVKDLLTGSEGSNPSSLTAAGGRLYFLANGISGSGAQQFYRTTVVGTDIELVTLPPIDPLNPVYGVGNLAFHNNTLYFSAEQNAGNMGASLGSGKELWTINNAGDASPGVATMQDLRPSGSSKPQGFVVANSKLYASASLSGSTFSLVKIDSNGATPIQSGLKDPKNFVAVGNTLYFSGRTDDDGTELWKLDTTNDQASLLSIAPDTTSSTPRNLVAVGTSVYFFANDGAGEGLWKVDNGSLTPTKVSITDASGMGTNPDELVAIDNVLYFSADNAAKGRELWSYNATTNSMKLLDINTQPDPANPGNTFSSNPGRLTNINGFLYFIADNGLDGTELMSL
jgi:ELWxxDGT repeat protein